LDISYTYDFHPPVANWIAPTKNTIADKNIINGESHPNDIKVSNGLNTPKYAVAKNVQNTPEYIGIITAIADFVKA